MPRNFLCEEHMIMKKQNKIFFGEVKRHWMRSEFLCLSIFVIRFVQKLYMFLFRFLFFSK